MFLPVTRVSVSQAPLSWCLNSEQKKFTAPFDSFLMVEGGSHSEQTALCALWGLPPPPIPSRVSGSHFQVNCPASAPMWSPIHSRVCLRLYMYGGVRKMESERQNCCPWGFLLQALTAGPDYFLPFPPCPSLFSTQVGVGEQVGNSTVPTVFLTQVTAVLLLGSFSPHESLNRLWRWSFPCPLHTPTTPLWESFSPISSMCCFPDTRSSEPYALFQAPSPPVTLPTWFSACLIAACLAGSPPATCSVGSLCWAPKSPISPFSGACSTQGPATSAALSTCCSNNRSCCQSDPSSATLGTLKGHEGTRSKTFSLSDSWSRVLEAQKYCGQVKFRDPVEGIVVVTERRHALPGCSILGRTLHSGSLRGLQVTYVYIL